MRMTRVRWGAQIATQRILFFLQLTTLPLSSAPPSLPLAVYVCVCVCSPQEEAEGAEEEEGQEGEGEG